MAARRWAALASSALILAAVFSASEAVESGSSSFLSSASVGTSGQIGGIRPPVANVSGLVMLLSIWPRGDLQHFSLHSAQPSLVMPSLFQMVGTGWAVAGAAGTAGAAGAAGAPGMACG